MASTVAENWANCDKLDVLFVITCSAICWGIVPAVGLGYSGYSTRRNSLASFYPALLAVICVTVQWWVVGYSLAYSEGNGFIGGLKYAFHRNVLAEPVSTIPAILFSEFQLIFCAAVAAIAVGGACERGRLLPLIPFIILWATFVYCPLAHMVWSDTGFLGNLGVVDFAGGTPVHICSGATATAISVYLSHPLFRSKESKIRKPSHLKLHMPHNTMAQLLAMVTIWGAWLAFDAGTTLSLNFKSVMAMCVTNTCASTGALTYLLINYFETGRFSLDSTFVGAISGLVMITPSAGFIGMGTAAFFGVVGALVSWRALRFKLTPFAHSIRWVDNGDSFATHCIGGLVGTIFTGLFASKEVAAYDGMTEIAGGVIFDGNFEQVGIQILEAVIGFTWAFGVSYLIYAGIDCIPGLEVLALDREVIEGLDTNQIEETLTGHEWKIEEDYEPFERGVLLE
ncbi:hypothetical protein SCUCBS95973_001581 [Sporothrix curviconia]|uniref:Ammonium transporter AmtB-like domain-containing protein n=1 Tax=Sporothrix curviconia TaxID=1260050 RepID=A0ABP0AZQ1_9PEZI